jgi:hypothetical protein
MAKEKILGNFFFFSILKKQKEFKRYTDNAFGKVKQNKK